MGVFNCETESTSSIPPTRLFKALILDADNLIPKIAPQAIKCTEILEGNDGPRTVKKITFGEGSNYKYVKHQVDEADAANFTYKYTVIEGDALGDVVEKISYETKLVASAEDVPPFLSRISVHLMCDLRDEVVGVLEQPCRRD